MNAKTESVTLQPEIRIPHRDIVKSAEIEEVGKVGEPPPALAPVPGATFGRAYDAPTLKTGEHPFVHESDPTNSLWTDKPVRPEPFDAGAFAKLPPAERRAQVDKLKARREALRGQIQERLGELDRQWKGSHASTRSHALRQYQHRSRNLDRATQQKLDGMLDRADAAQVKIDGLRKAGDQAGAGPPNAPEGAEVAAALTKARTEQEKAVTEAATLVEAKDLKSDLLAVAEQIIDVNAPASGTGESVLEQLAEFFHLDSLISTIMQVFEVTLDRMRDDNKRKRDEQLEATILEARLQQARRNQENVVDRIEQLRAFTKRLESR
jgi:hypothetical protein